MDANFKREFVSSQISAMMECLDELNDLNEAESQDWRAMKYVHHDMSLYYFRLGSFLLDRILEGQ